MSRAAAAVLVLASVAASACTSTQDKADQLARQGKDAFTEKGVRVARENPDVEVVDTAVLSDENGAAAVVVLRNRTSKVQTGLPVAIDVRGARKTVFRNDAPGLEASLTTLTALGPEATAVWVNDQVVASGKPEAVEAKVGVGKGAVPRTLPKLRATGAKLESSSTGLQARGTVRNDSALEQRDLVLYGVARKGDEVVAAGRAQVRRVRARSRTSFRMFFIGDPRGAELQIDVPPTRLTD